MTMSTPTETPKGQYSLVISEGDQKLCRPFSTLLDPEPVYSIHQQEVSTNITLAQPEKTDMALNFEKD